MVEYTNDSLSQSQRKAVEQLRHATIFTIKQRPGNFPHCLPFLMTHSLTGYLLLFGKAPTILII